MKRVTPDLAGEQDDEAEYDSPKTLQAIREAIASYGHEVVDLEATPGPPPAALASTPVDVVFNIAEGLQGAQPRGAGAGAAASCSTSPTPAPTRRRSRSRSTRRWPSAWCARTASSRPTTWSCRPGKERLPRSCEFPLHRQAGGRGHLEGRHRASRVVRRRGRAARGGARADRASTASRRWSRSTSPGASSRWASSASAARACCRPWRSSSSTEDDPTPSLRFEMKQDWNEARSATRCPAQLAPARARPAREGGARDASPRSAAATWRASTSAWTREGRIYFIECNPLPGPDAGLVGPRASSRRRPGIDYRALIGEILVVAIRRYQERERERERAPARPARRRSARRRPRRTARRRPRARQGGNGHGRRRRPERRAEQGAASIAPRRAPPGAAMSARWPSRPSVARLAAVPAIWGSARPLQAGPLERHHRRGGRARGPLHAHPGRRARSGSARVRCAPASPPSCPTRPTSSRSGWSAGGFVLNGAGEVSGMTQLLEWGLRRDPHLPHQHAVGGRGLGRRREVDGGAVPGHRRRARRHHPAGGRVRRLAGSTTSPAGT